MDLPKIAITMGDPAGVGPEICLDVIGQPSIAEICHPIVFGDASVLKRCAEKLGRNCDVPVWQSAAWADQHREVRGPSIVDFATVDATLAPGVISANTGQSAFTFLTAAIDAAKLRQVAAITTAPLNKEALHAADIRFPGHTEILATHTNSPRYCMLQFSDEVTASFVTTHVGYSEVPGLLTIDRIVEVIEISYEAVRKMKGGNPKIVVCGLNPHAGEGGLFGNREEETIITPAIEISRKKGITIDGPLPPDTAFLPVRRKETGCFICMYHDQGHIPLKALAFDTAVNVTLGLPIIRTSVDHGTANDIAWQGKASSSSMIQAITLATRLVSGLRVRQGLDTKRRNRNVTGKYSLVWDLDSLFPHPETEPFRDVVTEFEAELTALADASESLPVPSAETDCVATWERFLRSYEAVETRNIDLIAFMECHAAAEAENRKFQQLEAHFSSLSPTIQRAATNMEFALRDAEQADFDKFLKLSESLQSVEFFLRERRNAASLRLPREQESLASELAVDGIHAWGRLYDRLSGELRVQVMERGELIQKSVGQVQWDSPERTVRQNNFFAANKAWASIADTCADAINHIAGTRLTTYARVGLEDHLSVPLHMNRMRRETLSTMWNTINECKTPLLNYLKIKANALGVEKLAWYDLSAPFPGDSQSENKISYDDACDLITDTFHGFSDELGKFAQRAIDDQWIEVENRPGKRQGGFCTDCPTAKQSRIFMTYTDTPDGMSTLAHELGHAYHSFVLREEPGLLREYPMNLAETASTFAEAMLGERRLSTCSTNSEKIAILDNMLSDAVTFLLNIQSRFLFEDEFHRERKSGELSAERLGELMVNAQRQAFGSDTLSDDGWNPLFWASKLHFYISGWPFYNFPYTFGYLLSLGVYSIGEHSGPEFAEQYRKLLIATGAMNAEDAVASTLGFDLASPDFWRKSLEIITKRVETFQTLVQDSTVDSDFRHLASRQSTS